MERMEGVTTGDIIAANSKINSFSNQLLNDLVRPRFCASGLPRRLNEWQKPVSSFARHESVLSLNLKQKLGNFDVTDADWKNGTMVVDVIMELMLKEMKATASFEGLILDGFLKQGSARDGLKIKAANEFDMLLKYHITDMDIAIIPMSSPGLAKLLVRNNEPNLRMSFPSWLAKGVIVKCENSFYLSSRRLHERVFESIIDRSREKISSLINGLLLREKVAFNLTRRMNPPSVSLSITFGRNSQTVSAAGLLYLRTSPSSFPDIDIDIVPGMEVQGKSELKHYVVAKWLDDNQNETALFDTPSMVWRICTSAYEKHNIDIAREHTGKRYIMTACRIVKAYMSTQKEIGKSGIPPLPISTFMRSYFLKNITFYCFHFRGDVPGVKDALGCFLGFLNVCLEEGHLPQYFIGNHLLQRSFPSCSEGARFDLFRNVAPETMINVRRDMPLVLSFFEGMYEKREFSSQICERFREYIQMGDYPE
ncbi:hypothetical protein CHS0354_024370 [Potamilus streckersoni]|uniref:Mab-21-like nucleotidyltransferase domain-containing protein n=1 Tax=Potamilus streckersoni TaxID=2493646 RepID=A0AAE0W1J1_9BIVA|nr:hypothetical protein CHS0354_024370 [Potamilus streckersoni]